MTVLLRRRGVRTRLLLAVVGAVAVALAIAVAAFNFLLGQRLAASATSLAKARAEARASALEIRKGKLVVPEGPDDAPAASEGWVFAGNHLIEAPRVSSRLDAAARSLAGGPARSLNVGEHTKLYALPVVEDGVRYGTLVTAVSLAPYEETGRVAFVASLILAALLLGGVALLSRWMLGRALVPVTRMTESAKAWSVDDLGRRFEPGEPYDELTRLAATLDELLERIAASLRHEQRFAAELAHELRTPLARVRGETELMLMRGRTTAEYREALAAIQRNVDGMTRIVDALVAAARKEMGLSTRTSDAREAVEAAVAAAVDGGGADVRVSAPAEPVRVAVEQDLLARIVQPLVENAVRYGGSPVDISVAREGAVARVDVMDEGPGVTDVERERIFEPGERGSASARGPDGAGLGLALARRLANSAGAEISALPSARGARFSIRVPLA